MPTKSAFLRVFYSFNPSIYLLDVGIVGVLSFKCAICFSLFIACMIVEMLLKLD